MTFLHVANSMNNFASYAYYIFLLTLSTFCSLTLYALYFNLCACTSAAFPAIRLHPTNALEVNPGSDVTFSVTAILATAYQWKLNETNLADSEKYTGSKKSSLTIHNVQESDEGDYACVVGNRLVSILSSRARLTVCKFVH